jgi:predicted enzyme related to lactoylglutathione lyase
LGTSGVHFRFQPGKTYFLKEIAMDDQFQQHGAFSWSELLTTDIAAAKKFYSGLFGWEMEDMPMEGMEYTVVKAGGKEVGGMMPMPPEGGDHPPVWGNYVTVDDVDAVARTAEELGGKVHVPPQDIPGVGRFCVIEDPQGAYISAITYKMEE